jgi:hypothetical protein
LSTFSIPSLREPQDPSSEGTGSDLIFHCRDGETEAEGEGNTLVGPLSCLVSLTIAPSAGTERHGLEIGTISASGLDSHQMQCSGQD